MDESHSKIFGHPDVTGWKIIGLFKMFEAIKNGLPHIDDPALGNYTLTKYFLAFSVSNIIKDSERGKRAFSSFKNIIETGRLVEFVEVAANIAVTTAQDFNAEISGELARPDFDYKAELKSPNWCRQMASKLRADYQKDVARKRASPIDELLEPLGL